MLEHILVIGFRADVGAYIVYSYPEFDADDSNLDVMNVYNLHRFRTTERNFQVIKQGGFNIASYYSGFKNTNYIGAPDYCVTLLLDDNANPDDYEKVLIKVTNNILTHLGDDEIDYLLSETFDLLSNKQFDDIKVIRGEIDLDESPFEKKKIATTSSASLSDEEKIFDDLMQSDEFVAQDSEFDSKMNDFESAGVSDPFSGGGGADPFSGGSGASNNQQRNMFSENPFTSGGGGGAGGASSDPFSESEKPKLDDFDFNAFKGKQMLDTQKSSYAEIIQNLEQLDKNIPNKPAADDKEAQFAYLSGLVDILDAKIKVLGKLTTIIKELEQTQQEKDKLIGKLLLLLEGK